MSRNSQWLCGEVPLISDAQISYILSLQKTVEQLFFGEIIQKNKESDGKVFFYVSEAGGYKRKK